LNLFGFIYHILYKADHNMDVLSSLEWGPPKPHALYSLPPKQNYDYIKCCQFLWAYTLLMWGNATPPPPLFFVSCTFFL